MVKTTGAARNTLEQTRMFRSLGWEPHVFAEFINKENIEQSGGIPHKVFAWPLSNYKRRLLFAKNTERKIEKGDFDLVLGHGEIFNQDVLFLHNCVHLANELVKGKPLPKNHPVGQIHEKILTEQKFKLVVCNSNLMKADLHKRYQIPLEKLVTIHPGYSPEQFNMNQSDELRDAFRSNHKIDQSKLLIGLVTSGNFEKRNVDIFIKASSLLPENLLNQCQFIVVGKGPDSHWDKKLVEQLGLIEKFIFIEPIPDIEQIYHALDIQVLPAKWEEFGRVVLEGMACSKPVIVSNTVGSSELLVNASKDFILQSITPEVLAEKMTLLVESPDLRKSLGHLNRDTARKYSEYEQGKKLKIALEKYELI
ncbi:MAG: glycosyltransferase family 4 protein [Bdellovibrionales bacterium]